MELTRQRSQFSVCSWRGSACSLFFGDALGRRSSIRWTSTPRSAAAGEPTVLAIVETLIASAAVISLCIWTDSLRWILYPACVAPLFLLRTRFSDQIVLRTHFFLYKGASVFTFGLLDRLDAIAKRLVSSPSSDHGVTISYAEKFDPMLWAGVAGFFAWHFSLAARFCGALFGLLRRPVHSLASVSANWWRQCFCTDIFYPPEFFPGAELTDERLLKKLGLFRIRSLMRLLPVLHKDAQARISTVLHTFVGIGVILSLFIAYRLPLKSTSIILAPLAYSARKISHGDLALRHRLDDLLHGASERLQRWWASLTLVVSIGAIVVAGFSPFWSGHPFPPTDDTPSPVVLSALQFLYLPVWDWTIRLKGWHIARAVNAVLLFVVFFYADKASRRLDANVWTTRQIEHTLDSLFAAQWLLSAYLWFCGLIVFWRFMHEPGFWPTLDLQLLPY